MSALQRIQAVALARAFDTPFAVLQLVALTALAALAACGVGGGATVALTIVLALSTAVRGMFRTFDAIDALRWTTPVRRGRVVSAHFGFWLAVYAPLALIVAVARARDLLGAAILILAFALAVVAAAAIVMFYQRITRRGSGPGAMVAGIVVGSVLVWPAGVGLYLAWTGHWVSLALIGVVACVCVALGVPQFLRDELEPSAAGAVVASRSSRSEADERTAPRSPAASLLHATYPPFWTGFWVVFGGVLPLLLPSMNILAIWTPIAASNVAGIGLQSWRWLAATPIDRDRAFRVLFGPVLAFVLIVTAARLGVVETMSDRSVFFRDHRRDGLFARGPETLTLANLLEIGPSGNGYRAPEIRKVAEGVSAHLSEEYGLAASADRIEAELRPVWPERTTAADWDYDVEYVLDGLERVRVDVGDEIESAGRRRDFVIAGGLVLGFLVMLRAQFGGRLLGVFLVILVGLPLATLALFRRDFPAFAAATDRMFAALTGAQPAVLWLLLAGACVAGLLLWRSARNAFRRIDVLDIPPNPLAPRRR